MKRSIIKTLILTGALAAAGSALAFGGHHGFGGKECHRGGHGMKGAMQLESITDEQRQQFKALRSERRGAMQTLRGQMRENRKALRDAARESAPQATVAALAEKQGDLVEQMIIERMDMRRKMDEILTEEQRQELAQKRKERHGRKGE
jgi:Spy/CpxP family protein refolding chaperone